MTAPTEAEIRAAITRRMGERISGTVGGGLRSELANIVNEAADPLGWPSRFALEGLAVDLGGPPTIEEGALYGSLDRRTASREPATV